MEQIKVPPPFVNVKRLSGKGANGWLINQLLSTIEMES